VGYGPSIEEMAGLAALNGDPDGRPLKTGISYGDPMAGIMAAGAVGAALIQRDRTGEGQYIEVAQRDVMINVVGDALMAWGMNQQELPRTGNRDPVMAPQGCYPSRSLPADRARITATGPADECWLTLTVENDEQWVALCEVIGRADLAGDSRLATAAGRQEHHDEIDAAITEWTEQQSDREAADALLARGIPVSPVMATVDLGHDEHLKARGFLTQIEHPDGGDWFVSRPSWRLGRGGPDVRMAAPGFGRDNRAVLQGVLGLSDEEYEALVAKEITSSDPIR
jgi:crotonobetainyl-CoA:carnitine CoA-transferase CaiB-like acyl-CoA transferase